jgi:hypothetical protein
MNHHNILFIDDERAFDTVCSARYREKVGLRFWTKEELDILKGRPTPVVVRNYNEAIAELSSREFDLVFFDHDLGENSLSGMAIAKWVTQNIKKPFLFYVHSANPVGRENIQSLLDQYFQTLRDNKVTKLYVGRQEYLPAQIAGKPCPFGMIHPGDITLDGYWGDDFWTNNVYVVDQFTAENIVCCGPDGQKTLDQHPKYNEWMEEMSTGEFWSMFGENW